MIFVLPLLMYPLLGMSILQVSQFLREQPTKVLIVNLPKLNDLPQLVVDNHFNPEWLTDPAQQRLFELLLSSDNTPSTSGTPSPQANMADQVRQAILNNDYQAAVVFPPDFDEQLAQFRATLQSHSNKSATTDKSVVPNPLIYCNTANEKSHLAYQRVNGVLRSWAEAVAKQNLKDSELPEAVAKPFEFKQSDVSGAEQRTAALWSKILPFVLLLWALTGIFTRPSICAPAKKSVARWKRCSAVPHSAAKS